MRILVVGAGSIGKRHRDNLTSLGIQTATMDITRPADYNYLPEAIKDFHPDAAIISVPTYLHMNVALELADHNMPLFIEKPLSHSMTDIKELQQKLALSGQWAVVGYSLRFHPALQIIKDLLPQIGKPLYARAEVGQYLPDWHPTEDYIKWYMAHEAQGGGACLDLSHEIDYIQWMFGGIQDIGGYVGKISSLNMDADDMTDIQVHCANLPLASIHMDVIDRSYNRRLRILGAEATISWEWNQSVQLLKGTAIRDYFAYDTDRNIQFVNEMAAFVLSIQSGIPHPTLATFDDGLSVLQAVLNIKEQNER